MASVAVGDAVGVAPPQRGEARVEAFRGLDDAAYADVGGQQPVEPSAQRRDGPLVRPARRGLDDVRRRRRRGRPAHGRARRCRSARRRSRKPRGAATRSRAQSRGRPAPCAAPPVGPSRGSRRRRRRDRSAAAWAVNLRWRHARSTQAGHRDDVRGAGRLPARRVRPLCPRLRPARHDQRQGDRGAGRRHRGGRWTDRVVRLGVRAARRFGLRGLPSMAGRRTHRAPAGDGALVSVHRGRRPAP